VGAALGLPLLAGARGISMRTGERCFLSPPFAPTGCAVQPATVASTATPATATSDLPMPLLRIPTPVVSTVPGVRSCHLDVPHA
jgi:hypothetical protein